MIQYEGELLHHGVKGMKWGVRRYQNSDGTLKPKAQKAVKAYDTYKKIDNSITMPKHNKDGSINKKWDKLTNDYHIYYNKNSKLIKKGRKIRAKQGNTVANIEQKQGTSNKYGLAALGTGIISAVAFKKAFKSNKLKAMWDISKDTTMSELYRKSRNRKIAAGVIAASAAVTLKAISKGYQKKADKYREKHWEEQKKR